MAERKKLPMFWRAMIVLASLGVIAAGVYVTCGYWVEQNAVERARYDENLVAERRRWRNAYLSVAVLEKCGPERFPEPRLDDLGAIERRRRCVEGLIGLDPRNDTEEIDRLDAAKIGLLNTRSAAQNIFVVLAPLLVLSLFGRWIWNVRARS